MNSRILSFVLLADGLDGYGIVNRSYLRTNRSSQGPTPPPPLVLNQGFDAAVRVEFDQVLFLKHNLNAQAVASLHDELVVVEAEIASLIKEMETSIAALFLRASPSGSSAAGNAGIGKTGCTPVLPQYDIYD